MYNRRLCSSIGVIISTIHWISPGTRRKRGYMAQLSPVVAEPEAEQLETRQAEAQAPPSGPVRPRAESLVPEPDALESLLAELMPLARRLSDARLRARYWFEAARSRRWPSTFADALLARFPLGSEQGRALMSLAEAL